MDDFLCQIHSDEYATSDVCDSDPPEGWYDEPDLRDNTEREFIGLSDWQAEFPLVEPTPQSEAFEEMFS